jgi:FkbM family methyltransferase
LIPILKALRRYIQRRDKRFLDKAMSVLPEFTGLNLVDVGAAGKIEQRWESISQHLNYIGFEPDERSRELLAKQPNGCKSYSLKENALWSEKTRLSFNVCKGFQASSLLPPNFKFISKYPDSDRVQVIDKFVMNVVSLDSLALKEIDFIKMDTQGAEIQILMGGKKTLNEVLGLELELMFAELYQNQAQFGEVKNWAEEQGFEFLDFLNLARWERDKLEGYGQCVFGDALFMRVPESLNFENLKIRKISSYLAILLLYRRFDLIQRSLEFLPERKRKSFLAFNVFAKKLERRNKKVRLIHKWLSRFILFFGTDYKFHLFN